MFASLLQVGTIQRTIERDFTLFPATLRANSPVYGGTETLFFPDFTDGAAQIGLPFPLCHLREIVTENTISPTSGSFGGRCDRHKTRGLQLGVVRKPVMTHLREHQNDKTRVKYVFFHRLAGIR